MVGAWWLPVMLGVAGCDDASRFPVVTSAADVRCADGHERVTLSDDTDRRTFGWHEGTEVVLCRDGEGVAHGPHVERYAGGSVAVIGAWFRGRRHGAWTRWREDGAFVERVDHHRGIRTGVQRRLTPEGRVLEMVVERGELTSLKGLPLQTPMPEWRDGALAEGRAHQGQMRDSTSDALNDKPDGVPPK